MSTSEIIIEEFGDSTTAGYTTYNGQSMITTGNQSSSLQRLLDAEFGQRCRVRNEGVGGTQAANQLNGTNGRHVPFAQLMQSSPSSIVTLNFGLNDAYFNRRPVAGQPNVGPQEFFDIMAQLVGLIRQNGKVPIVYEPNPSTHPGRVGLDYYAMQLSRLHTELGVSVVSQYWALASRPDLASLLSDGTHPTDALYAIKAQNAYQVVRQAVTPLL